MKYSAMQPIAIATVSTLFAISALLTPVNAKYLLVEVDDDEGISGRLDIIHRQT